MKIFRSVKRRRRIRGGTLLLISTLMIGSAVLRFGVEAAPTISREMNKPLPDNAPAIAMAEPTDPERADFQVLISAINSREALLDAREARIQDRMKALTIADAAIEQKLVALVHAEEQLSATLALADGAAEGDLTRLTDVYEKMKPKDAAALFEEMNPEFSAGFLGRMRPEIAAGVMAKLSPKAAYSISVILAGRNTAAPRE